MYNAAGAPTNAPSYGRGIAGGQHLDSPDLTHRFLAAAGLTGAPAGDNLEPEAVPRASHQHRQHTISSDFDSGGACLRKGNVDTHTGRPAQTSGPEQGWLTHPVEGQLDGRHAGDAREDWGVTSSCVGAGELVPSITCLAHEKMSRKIHGARLTLPPTQRSSIPASSELQRSAAEAIDHQLITTKSPSIMGPRKNPPAGLKEAARYQPDLTTRRVPRPNMRYAGSPPPSLPSVSINDSDVGVAGSIRAQGKTGKDIRNEIAPKYRWYQTGDNRLYSYSDNDSEVVLTHPSYFRPFILAWMTGVAPSVTASFACEGGLEHWKSDVDTNTGLLLPPVGYPDTMVDQSRITDAELDWRRQNWTSSLLMRRHMDMRRRQMDTGRDPQSDAQFRPRILQRDEPQQDPFLAEPAWFVEVIEPKYEKPEFHPYVPRIPCFLRPAEKKYDMEAVCHIYNQEMQSGLQTVDSQPLTAEDFEKILSTAQKLGMPFIVAVRGSARDLGLTKGNLVYSPYRQVPTDESDPHSRKRGEILGFAFMSVWEPGLAGGGTGTSRATAKANVFVHRDHRRKKIGFSLLDMLLTTASDRFSSQSGYNFVDPDNSPVYKPPRHHERKYFRIYLAYLVRHKHRLAEEGEGNKKLEEEQKGDDADLAWVRKLLEEGFNFTEKVRFEAVHCTPKGREGQPVGWLDAVVFEHTCQFDPKFIGDC